MRPQAALACEWNCISLPGFAEADFLGRKKKQTKTKEVEDSEWHAKFGAKGAKVIREVVDSNVENYEYLKQFALRV